MSLKMITESVFDITTSVNESEDGKKELFIEGIFATAEKKNKNGRLYPKALLEREVSKVMSSVSENTLLGELNHPIDRSEVDLNEAAIKVTELKWNKNDVMGKAKILSTPKGCIVKNLIEDGVKIGISSRGLGTVSEGEVNNDFQLLCWDIVHSPSNIGSWMNGILEGVEFNTDNKQDEIKFLKEELEKYKHNYELLKEHVKSEVKWNWIEKILNKL